MRRKRLLFSAGLVAAVVASFGVLLALHAVGVLGVSGPEVRMPATIQCPGPLYKSRSAR